MLACEHALSLGTRYGKRYVFWRFRPAPSPCGAALIDLVDVAALAGWLDEQGFPPGPVQHLVQLEGGTQNLLVRFCRAGTSYVLRRPSRHPRPRAGEIILREARVLEALAATDVPHPRWAATCADESVLGIPFVVMRAVDGVNPMVQLPSYAGAAAGRRQLGRAAATELARIGRVDYLAVGLADFGRPDGFLSRQVPRWLTEWDSYRHLPGYPGEPLPGMDELAAFLTGSQPPGQPPGLMHGDFHFGNLLVDAGQPRVAAVLDWEMATIGDPLVDLGRFVASLPGENETMESGGALWEAGDVGPVSEIVAAYSAISDRSLDALDWYVVLACFKLGIILESSNARACAGLTDAAIGDRLHAMALALFARGRRVAQV
jgi:aminoglycoside phosphotransferase (APT) family kinase protein